MCEKIQNFWNSLDVNVKVNKRELLLGVTACTLMGVVVGMLVSPRTNLSVSPQMNMPIGSNNCIENPQDETGDEPEQIEE